MQTPIRTARRELAHRVAGGLEVTLYWSASSDCTSVDVHHTRTDQTISFRVPADRALDAFRHPFAHLAQKHTALAGCD
jgi:hypothetical protein